MPTSPPKNKIIIIIELGYVFSNISCFFWKIKITTSAVGQLFSLFSKTYIVYYLPVRIFLVGGSHWFPQWDPPMQPPINFEWTPQREKWNPQSISKNILECF